MEKERILEQKRDLLISTINKTITEVKVIRDEMKKNKMYIDEIQDIKQRLSNLQSSLGPKRDWFSEKSNSLDTVLNELLELKLEINVDSVDDMFKCIRQNLIDDMNLENVSKEKGDLIVGKGDLTVGDENVGSIEVKKDRDNNELKIIAEVLGIKEDFQVDNPYRMFSIITFINTKYNYYSTINQNK